MKLIPKRIPIKVGNKYIAIVNEKAAEMLDLRAADRILLKVGRKDITAILDITEDDELRDTQIGLYSETWAKLGVKRGDKVNVTIAPKPEADIYIKEKLMGKKLSKRKLDVIIKDVVEDDLSDVEMTYFVSGCFCNGLDDEETANLTKSIVEHGDRLIFKNKIVMDKHCIGGVPGNRTTMLVVPIVTALGFLMPKTSSRAITSPAGTADTMEAICNVVNDAPKLKRIIKKVGGFITWGGGVDLAGADDRLIRVRYPLKLDPEGMMLASIMAKKYSVSSNHVIIDIPVGPQAKVKSAKAAEPLRKRFLTIAKKLGMKAKVVITDGSQPIGNGVGPLLECHDVIKVLKNEADAPKDLRAKAIMLASTLISQTAKYKNMAKAKKAVEEVLNNGKAWKKFEQIITAQGLKKKKEKLGTHLYYAKAAKSGKVTHIHNKKLAAVARTAGAPNDYGAGVFVHKKVRNKIKKGDILYTVYCENKSKLAFVKKLNHNEIYTIK